MKSQAIDHKILAMKAKLVQLRENLALSKNVKQAGTKKTGEGTNKQHQKKDVEWKKVPPKAGEPLIKRIRDGLDCALANRLQVEWGSTSKLFCDSHKR